MHASALSAAAMNDDIPFDKRFELPPGQVEEIAPGVRRLLCNNPGPFTYKGTVSYIIGRGRVAIIDPGPLDEAHAAALLDAVRAETVTHIVITHTHRDHSPGAAGIKAATGALSCGEGPHRSGRSVALGEAGPLDSSGDMTFKPDRALRHGDVIEGDDWALEAIFTPGHCANHMAYALRGTDILFSGDHVMAWSTPVVAPPDGSMRDYMASLETLARRPETTYYPGHGPAVRNAPRFVRLYISHRRAREAMIVARLKAGETEIPAIVRDVYVGLDARLTRAAGLSVLAHLEDLVARGVVSTDGEADIAGRYRLAVG
ncbi:MAG: MBL fold metallo-hydrolase [Hyphomicrobiales bacterium]|nr:MBL fold metallo-hydrolase [Hyphomicrobiales bacterium]